MQEQRQDEIAAQIRHVLSIYPTLSPSMLQIGIGPHVPPQTWRPILSELIEAGVVKRDEVVAQTPSGRHRSYTRLSLNTTPQNTRAADPDPNLKS